MEIGNALWFVLFAIFANRILAQRIIQDYFTCLFTDLLFQWVKILIGDNSAVNDTDGRDGYIDPQDGVYDRVVGLEVGLDVYLVGPIECALPDFL